MLMKSWLRMVVMVFGVGLVLAVESWGGTSDVFQLHTFIQGVISYGGFSTNPVIHSVQIRDVDLINLGLGSPLGTRFRRTNDWRSSTNATATTCASSFTIRAEQATS